MWYYEQGFWDEHKMDFMDFTEALYRKSRPLEYTNEASGEVSGKACYYLSIKYVLVLNEVCNYRDK